MKTIRAKILFVAFVAAVLFCCVITWITLSAADNYRALLTSDCSSEIYAEFEKIEDTLVLYGEQAKDLARLGGVYYRISKRAIEIDRNSILDNLGFQHDFIGGGIWYEPYSILPEEERHCFYAYKDGESIVYDEEFEGAVYNYPNQDWYTSISGQLKEGKKTAWYGPYVDEAGTHAQMMTVGAGIYDKSGTLVGISTADLSIDFILELSSKMMFTTGTVVSAVYDETGVLLGGKPASGQTGEMLDFTRLFGNGIRVFVSIPTSELFSEVNTMMGNMAIVVSVIVLASFLVIYGMLDRFLNRPLATLTEKTRQIGDGNLDTVINIINNDEIGQLGATINKMTSDIKQYIENLSNVTRENERIRSELEIAAKIQREMLPELNTENERYRVYAEMTPCREVGGDFYDAFLIEDERLCIVIADVSGKGVPAALFMAKAKTAIRTYSEADLSAAEIIYKVNTQLAAGNKARMFVTVFFGILDLLTGEFTYVNAGHNKPLIMRKGQVFDYLDTQPGLVLGVLKHEEYNEIKLSLNNGDRIFLYTDGVTEAFNAGRKVFGEARLQNALNEYKDTGLVELAEGLKRELANFADGAPVHDDVTMICVEFIQ